MKTEGGEKQGINSCWCLLLSIEGSVAERDDIFERKGIRRRMNEEGKGGRKRERDLRRRCC